MDLGSGTVPEQPHNSGKRAGRGALRARLLPSLDRGGKTQWLVRRPSLMEAPLFIIGILLLFEGYLLKALQDIFRGHFPPLVSCVFFIPLDRSVKLPLRLQSQRLAAWFLTGPL